MKNLKRLRSWLVELSVVCWRYTRRVRTFRSSEPTKNNKSATTAPSAASNAKYDPSVISDQTAQRLARLLVSEIKLYYMSKMDEQAGTVNNVYDLLKGPIDKSRQHYKQRLGTKAVESMPDYFHDELVSSLCGGEASRLGPNYRSAR